MLNIQHTITQAEFEQDDDLLSMTMEERKEAIAEIERQHAANEWGPRTYTQPPKSRKFVGASLARG